MSKANRREEIRRKEELQAKIKVSLAQADDMVTSWLAPYKAKEGQGAQIEKKNEDPLDPFMGLPIIPSGASLASASSDSNYKTIKDFIEMKSLNRSDFNPRGDGKRNGDSRALNSLANRLRDSRRNKISRRVEKPRESKNDKKNIRRPSQDINTGDTSDSDSDDVQKALSSRTVKKGNSLLMDRKIKKRPF